MKNLLELTNELTSENIVKRGSKENINESILRILYDEGQKLTRVDLISRISLDRLINEHSQEVLDEMIKTDEGIEKFKKLLKSTNRTVKNGVDTSISRSNNNSSFHYNEKYANYKLELKNGLYQVSLRK